jgi:hypothetical protein
VDRRADLGPAGLEQAAVAAAARVNGHGWMVAVVVAVAGFIAGVIWSLHANDAAQSQQLMAFEARSVVAREAITNSMERIARLEQELALLKQKIEALP